MMHGLASSGGARRGNDGVTSSAPNAPTELPDHILPAASTINQVLEIRRIEGVAELSSGLPDGGPRRSTRNWGSARGSQGEGEGDGSGSGPARPRASTLDSAYRMRSASQVPGSAEPLPGQAAPSESLVSPRGERLGSRERDSTGGGGGVNTMLSDTSSFISFLSVDTERGDGTRPPTAGASYARGRGGVMGGSMNAAPPVTPTPGRGGDTAGARSSVAGGSFNTSSGIFR
jgi:hypothetical protein